MRGALHVAMRPGLLVAICLLHVACATAHDGADDLAAAAAPLIGVDGSLDQADRGCHVVLRTLARNWTGFTWETEGSNWVWSGVVETSDAAATEGLVPSVMYRLAPSGAWTVVAATPLATSVTPGFAAHAIRIHAGLPGPGWSGTSLANARLEVVPFLALPEGGRLFDHNRNPGDLDNYLAVAPGYAIDAAPTACAASAGPARARLVFAADFTEQREGLLVPGGEVAIVYDPARLSTCRHSQGGQPLYDVTAHVRFEPGQQRRDQSVRDGAAVMVVPTDARAIVLWFENTSASGCQAWDSNLGANYTFDVLAPPQWLGDARTLLTRDTTDACSGGLAAAAGFTFDGWARQRAAVTNACFEVYQPGLTDRDDPELWQKLDARLAFRFVGVSATAWDRRPIELERRVGNNARYRIGLRPLDPFRSYHCPEVAPRIAGDVGSIDVEYVIEVNGRELRPQPGAAFVGTYVDDAHDAWRDANCP